MRHLLFALVVTLMSAPLFAQTGDYYPLKKGSQWTYKVEGQKDQFLVKVEQGEKETWNLIASVNGTEVARETVAVGPEGIARTKYGSDEIKPGVVFFKPKAKKGDTWTQEFEVAKKSAKITFTTDEAKVKVPAGEYDAIVVKGEVTEGASKITTTYWFVEKIGMVRQVIDFGENKIILELEKYEEGK